GGGVAMTYCMERTNLLARAGEPLAVDLLPDAFRLYYSNHETGRQMRIVTAAQPAQTVWQGAVWHHSRYEFNDRGHVPGLQPDFAFAQTTIDAYFARVSAAVEARDYVDNEEAKRQAALNAAQKKAAIDATRAALAKAEA